MREALRIWRSIDDPADDEVQMYLARGYHNLGVLLHENGLDDAEAEAALVRAVEIQERLVKEHGSVTGYRVELAGSCDHLCALYRKASRAEEALPLLERAETLRSQLAAVHPYDAALQSLHATTCMRLAALYEQLNRAPEAEALTRKAAQAQERLAALLAEQEQAGPAVTQDDGEALRVLGEQADVYEGMAGLAASLGQGERLAAASQRAIDLRRRIVKARGSDQDRSNLAGALLNLANYHQEAGAFDKAEPGFQEAIALWKALDGESGGQGRFLKHLADAHSNLGNLLRLTDRPDAAEPHYRDALALRRRVAEAHPKDPAALAPVLDSLGRLGRLHEGQLNYKEAESEWNEALSVAEQLFRRGVASSAVRDYLVEVTTGLNDLLKDLRRDTEAAAVVRRGLAILGSVPPPGAGIGYERAMFLLARGNLQMASDPSAAAASYREAIALLDPLSRQTPTNTNYAICLGGLYCNMGNFASRSIKDPSKAQTHDRESLDWYKKAIDILEATRAKAPQNAQARKFLANAYRGRMAVYLLSKRRVEAMRDLLRAAPLERGKFMVILPELAKKVIDELEPFEGARLSASFAAFGARTLPSSPRSGRRRPRSSRTSPARSSWAWPAAMHSSIPRSSTSS